MVYDIRMKIKILSASLLAACLTAGTAWSQDIYGNTTSKQIAQNWESFIVSFPKMVTAYRATSWSTDRQLLLVFDAFKPNCYLTMSFMLPGKTPSKIDNKIDMTAVFYIDRNPAEPNSIVYKTYANQRMIFIDVLMQNNTERIYHQMLAGNTASIRFEELDGKHIQTFQFSMLGITQATNRAVAMCNASGQAPAPAPSRPQNRSPNNPGAEKNDGDSLRNLTPRNTPPAQEPSSPATPAPTNSGGDSLFKKAI